MASTDRRGSQGRVGSKDGGGADQTRKRASSKDLAVAEPPPAAAGNQLQVWENTYIMAPKDHEKFLPSKVTAVIERVLNEYLKDKEYQVDDAKIWTLEISNDIKAAVKELNIPRYKIIVQVVIGEQGSQGIRCASKSLWDTSSDNWASANFQNLTIFAVGMVFGCYYE